MTKRATATAGTLPSAGLGANSDAAVRARARGVRGLYYTREAALKVLKSRGLIAGRDLRVQRWLRVDSGSPRAVFAAARATGARVVAIDVVPSSEVARLAARRLRDAARRLAAALRVRGR